MLQSVKGLCGLLVVLIIAGCQPDLGLDQKGQKVAHKEWSGKWLVINYWATWCAPCIKEIPEFNRLQKALDQNEVKLFAVNFDGLQGEELAQASDKMGIQFTVLAQDPAERFGIERSQVLPITHIVGPDGRVRASLAGEQTADGLIAKLKSLQE